MGEAIRMRDKGVQFKQLQPGQQIQVDLKNTVPKFCQNKIGQLTEMGVKEHTCGCELFIPAVKVYTLSALLSPTGQELTAQQPVLVCKQCGELLK